jgi:hypothetical protein
MLQVAETCRFVVAGVGWRCKVACVRVVEEAVG